MRVKKKKLNYMHVVHSNTGKFILELNLPQYQT